MSLKQTLYKQCLAYVLQREQTVNDIISSNKKALLSETKSSAGDKHETGRAMLQLEMEKASQQIAVVQQMKETLAKINLTKEVGKASLGSVIKTNNTNYFLSISAGQLTPDNSNYFAISVSSPIGRLLLGKQKNDEFVFNGKTVKIIEII
jgi:transcription elongation GreA/GreB family factor